VFSNKYGKETAGELIPRSRAFNEIQVSPRYSSGLALRFARVKRYRPDKSADEADTFETVQKMAAG